MLRLTDCILHALESAQLPALVGVPCAITGREDRRITGTRVFVDDDTILGLKPRLFRETVVREYADSHHDEIRWVRDASGDHRLDPSGSLEPLDRSAQNDAYTRRFVCQLVEIRYRARDCAWHEAIRGLEDGHL